jgi:hypothetical protein
MESHPPRQGFFRGIVQAYIRARERQAESYVNGTLLMLDDETLRAHGYDRAELQRRRHADHFF